MRVSECVKCAGFPCAEVDHHCYVIPDVDIDPEYVKIIMISETAPSNSNEYYYAKGNPLFQQTTVQAFRDAGANVSTIKDILGIGVYFTTAVKCGKTGYKVKASTIRECSLILENEMTLFPNAKVFMLMGDVAIDAINQIAKRKGEPRVIPAGSTYKIRNQEYYFRGKRVFPSYLQAGSSFFIEKSKRRMISEDIIKALTLVK